LKNLICKDPARVIEEWKSVARCKRIIWHVEAPIDHLDLILKCKDMGKEVGLSISPKTSLIELAAFLHRIDVVLVMGVEPGSSGQSMLPETVDRVDGIIVRCARK
jgi:ribulose-phosphate 3-epimerase